MNCGRTIFAQLMELVPGHRLRQHVQQYGADKGVRKLSCKAQFQALAFAQLTGRDSLRAVEIVLDSFGRGLYHLGFPHRVARSTLAQANEQRDYRLWRDLAYDLIARTRSLYAGEDAGLDLDGALYALDCTVVDLCLSLFPWAQHRRHKSAVRIHTLLDLVGAIPTFVEVTPGHQHEVAILDQIALEPGAYWVMDKGYLDFARLYRLAQAAVYFVLRAKQNQRFRRLHSRPVDKARGLCSDQTIALISPKTSRLYPQPLRRVHYRYQESLADLVFLTNNFQLPALTVAQVYEQRWRVELFFKWIKQHLRIKAFYGTSPNAVKTQIDIAVAVYTLVVALKKMLKLSQTPYTLLQMLSLHLGDKVPLNQLLTNSGFQLDDEINSKQMILFN
jgi:hypothetical protein